MRTITFILITFITLSSCKEQLNSKLGYDFIANDMNYKSGPYLGLDKPDSIPRLFAPNIITNGLVNRDITISPDGNEIYFTMATPDYRFATVFGVKQTAGKWGSIEVVSFGSQPDIVTIEPCLSYDGQTLFFASDRSETDSIKTGNMNIWKSIKTGNSWGTPALVGQNINSSFNEYYPSVTINNSIYFTREEENGINYIYRSKFNGVYYEQAEKLPDQVNCGLNRFNAFIDPNERFIIVPAIGVEKEVTGANYYISFRSSDDRWSNPVNMGNIVNENIGRGWSASLSPDGKYLFFMSSKGLSNDEVPASLSNEFMISLQSSPQNGNADIYWVEANFIEDLRLKAVF